MTNKQFVLKIYPGAYSRAVYGDAILDWAVYNGSRIISMFVPEATAKIAWGNAVKNIQKAMLEKLES